MTRHSREIISEEKLFPIGFRIEKSRETLIIYKKGQWTVTKSILSFVKKNNNKNYWDLRQEGRSFVSSVDCFKILRKKCEKTD